MMDGYKKLFLCLFICYFTAFNCIDAAGLKEEFTWTRIDYLWPRESRSGFGGYRPNRPNKVIASSYGGFIFPDDDAMNPSSTTSTTRRPSTSTSDITYIYGKFNLTDIELLLILN